MVPPRFVFGMRARPKIEIASAGVVAVDRMPAGTVLGDPTPVDP
ncbi:hypothetical protein DER29_2560 [Micromonospora sp. M71_S20]|nr:hypothetical protein DER29_2560 [Micromonospora sp. M71_S20]